MQPEKSQYLKMGRQTLAATLLVVTATLTIAGPVRAESLCSPRGRIDALVTTGTVPDASSRPRPYATTPGGNDATWLAGDGHPAKRTVSDLLLALQVIECQCHSAHLSSSSPLPVLPDCCSRPGNDNRPGPKGTRSDVETWYVSRQSWRCSRWP